MAGESADSAQAAPGLQAQHRCPDRACLRGAGCARVRVHRGDHDWAARRAGGGIDAPLHRLLRRRMDATRERRRIRMRTVPRQLALAREHQESFAREDFLGGPSNAAALALVECWPQWPGCALMLTGPEGSGKSHLAAVWADAAGARAVAGRALEQAMVPAMLAT